MEILNGEFIKGVIGDDYSTKDNLPQIAFFGRSNVGKSSVINSLVNRKNLVKVSKVPGKTKEANFFLINKSFYFLDFPGYGYAKFSVKERNKIVKRIFWYLENTNKKPEAIFLIIDAKVGLTDLDREMIKNVQENNHKIVIIANKIDKVKSFEKEERIAKISQESGEISVFPYSAKTKKGKDELIAKITDLVD